MSTQARNLKQESPAANVTEAIYSRRAVRSYSTQPVTDEQIKTLLDAAIHAPSAMNSQPWAFVIVQRPDLLKRISDASKAELMRSPEWIHGSERGHVPIEDPRFDIFYGATTLVVICMSEETGFSPLGDCYLAAQNFMLAACELGLATCPIGLARDVLREEPFKRELSIPEGYAAVLPIIVGYPASPARSLPAPLRRPPKILSWIRSK